MNFEAENVPLEKLPQPAGWRILVAPVKIEKVSQGGIVLVDDTTEAMQYFRNVGKVLAVGSECYKHPKFQGGIELTVKEPRAWCKVGDIIHFNSFNGADIVLHYEGEAIKLKIMNDDCVFSVIPDTDVLKLV